METLLYLVLATATAGLIAASILMYKLITTKKTR